MSAQGFSQELRQRQTQNLVLAPQLRQSLKILQVAALDLRQAIQEEIQTNPTLEELPSDDSSAEPAEENSGEEADPQEELRFDEDFSILSKLDDDWRDFMAEAAGTVYTREDAERRQHFFDSVVAESSLYEHLASQAGPDDLTPDQRTAFDLLVGSLDDRGFLDTPLPDLALSSGLPLADLQAAAELLRTLDPPGIGARNLPDCLLIQLTQCNRADALAARIVKDHFKLLTRRRIPELARKLGADLEDVQQAIEEIATLDPAPGRRFGDDSNRVVVPDLTIEKEDGEWVVKMNSDYIPRLRLSQSYKNLIAQGRLKKDERTYLQEKLRSGKFLINSIEQRQQTIERITREIVRQQVDFFEEGVSRLRPLTMTQVADAVGVHETTVSRAIANKYARTPHGVFELKYFFAAGYRSEEGNSISNTSVKDRIAHLVDQENPLKPLSDQELVGILAEGGITIARRTVAKYREELGILPSNLRRHYA
ncbi:MAG: RNA polymerase sigma-54 factor [Puniceicoccaceae bacterium]|nr:MAG: RNA polymerase sigma-54 factor [Puniceicoccaceae bacterium]